MSGVQNQMMLVIGGVLVLVFGILLADVVIDTTVTALTNASIGSFAGASAIGGLIPFIYFTMVILLAVGMMGIGARGFLGVWALPVALPALPAVSQFGGPAFLAGIVALASVQLWRSYMDNRRRNSPKANQV